MLSPRVLVICAALTLSSPVLGAKVACPTREAGAGYPWQDLTPMKADRYAWVIVDVDRTGRPIRCGVGDNNIPDREMRFLLCNAYKGDWRAPPASAGDPDVRTVKRRTTMVGYEHQMADKKARRAWFKQHPEERAECYPE